MDFFLFILSLLPITCIGPLLIYYDERYRLVYRFHSWGLIALQIGVNTLILIIKYLNALFTPAKNLSLFDTFMENIHLDVLVAIFFLCLLSLFCQSLWGLGDLWIGIWSLLFLRCTIDTSYPFSVAIFLWILLSSFIGVTRYISIYIRTFYNYVLLKILHLWYFLTRVALYNKSFLIRSPYIRSHPVYARQSCLIPFVFPLILGTLMTAGILH